MSKPKVIHFFRLDMYTLKENDKGNSFQSFLDITSKDRYLMDIVENHLNENNAVKIVKEPDNPQSKEAIFEVITHNDKYVFGKLGKEHDINQFETRENNTLKSQPLSKGSNELFEAFSYVLIDRSTFSVSYIKESTAPSILFLSYLITNIFKQNDKIWGHVESLVDEDAISLLSGKDIIGTLSYDITLPAGYYKNISGLSEDEYTLLQNQKGTKVTVELKAKKRKESVFDSPKKARDFFNFLKREGKEKIKVKAKDASDELMQDYQLVDNPLTKKAKFNYDDEEDLQSLQKQIEEQLWLKFNQNKTEILKYIGFDSAE